MKRSIEIIKNRSDIGAGTRGSDLGIDAIEIAAINKGSRYFNVYPYIDVPTRNSSIYHNDVNPFGKHIKQIYEQCKQLASTVSDSLLRHNFPLVFSGDHSSALGTISGIKAAYPSSILGVIWIDAHADIHSPYTTPSGNMHGMPLAAAIHQDNLACQRNDVNDDTKIFWEKLKHIAVAGSKVDPQHLVYFGVRDTEEAEDKLIKSLHVTNYSVVEVRNQGLKICVEQTLEQLKACDLLYISFDVDSMDSDRISRGTGTPVPQGFEPSEISLLLQEFVQSHKVVCLEIVEINPLLDNQGNRMAEVAFEILEEITPFIEKEKNPI